MRSMRFFSMLIIILLNTSCYKNPNCDYGKMDDFNKQNGIGYEKYSSGTKFIFFNTLLNDTFSLTLRTDNLKIYNFCQNRWTYYLEGNVPFYNTKTKESEKKEMSIIVSKIINESNNSTNKERDYFSDITINFNLPIEYYYKHATGESSVLLYNNYYLSSFYNSFELSEQNFSTKNGGIYLSEYNGNNEIVREVYGDEGIKKLQL